MDAEQVNQILDKLTGTGKEAFLTLQEQMQAHGHAMMFAAICCGIGLFVFLTLGMFCIKTWAKNDYETYHIVPGVVFLILALVCLIITSNAGLNAIDEMTHPGIEVIKSITRR